MTIVITRTRTKGEYTEGYLSIDGDRICSTLENSNAQVPSGEYQLSLLKCKQYSRKMICLHGSAPCSQCPKLKLVCSNSTLPCWCPQIKPGNGVHNRLDGSIIVGVYNCPGSIIKPRDIFDTLYERIRKSISRGNQVKLIIV